MNKLLENASKLRINHCIADLTKVIIKKEEKLSLDYGLEKICKDEFNKLPEISPSIVKLSSDWIQIGSENDISEKEHKLIYSALEKFSPWRKGPFDLFGIKIDTEWVSYIKWNRLKNKISSLKGKRVLDIGCSSGYYMLRMLEHKPSMVLGVDPQILFYYQFLTLTKYIDIPDIYYIPGAMEELPTFKNYFDTIFSMGILYHRKSPVEALQNIHKNLKKGGELVLETLIIEGDSDTALFPVDRYAKMKNVYFIPSVKCLDSWLKRAKFTNIKIIDISRTTSDEQRRTKWINTESLDDFLDPSNPLITVEGYPAPVRIVITAMAY